MRLSLCRVVGAFVLVLAYLQGMAAVQASTAALVASDIGGSQRDVYGIAAHERVFVGACKACPWGIFASVTKEALKSYGYDVKICWVCWSSYELREIVGKTKLVMPRVRNDAPKRFAFAVTKATDENRDIFHLQAEPWYYDSKIVTASFVIPMHPGALQYYRERGYVQ